MSFSMNKSINLLFILSFTLLFSQINFANTDWRPVSKDELEMKQGKVEKDADAEVIFWEVRVTDEYKPKSGYQSVIENYIRIKIFTDRGREANSSIQIPYGRISSDNARTNVSKISARTTKVDGTKLFLNEKDIFEQEIVKGDGIKLNGKSFVVPGIEAGAIIEYRWREFREDAFSFYIRLQLAKQIPVQHVKYFIKPISYNRFTLAMRIQTFNINANLKKEDKGYYSITAENLRSFKQEPYMPPEYGVRPWVLIYYADADDDTGVSNEKYWKNVGRRTFESHKSIYKGNKQLRQTVKQAVGDANDELEKVRRIFYYCRENIKNINDDALNLSPDDRDKIKENKTEKDTLKRGQGTGHDLNMVFAAMLNEAGFDVRVANVALRSNPVFKRTLLNTYLLGSESIAVKIDGKWQFFDPSLQHIPFGMLSWAEEGQTVLISDNKEPIWEKIPASKYEQSKQIRTVNLKMNESGGIEGDVKIEYSGHLATTSKENFDDDTDDERKDAIIEMVKSQISETTEVTDIRYENINNPEKPLVYKFNIKSPSYANRTGKRLLFQPNIFAKSAKSKFATSSRQNDIFFRFPWSEEDLVKIKIPDGYTLESADHPDSIKDSSDLGLHKARINFDAESRKLIYKREFSFGRSGSLEFDSQSFSLLKDLFDSYQNADQHTVTLLVK